ncbi:MAG: adenylosuccinate lyase [Myxococcota bacterium]
MIPRYTRPEMGAIWTDEARLRRWLQVEVWALEAMARLGLAPSEVVPRIKEKADKLDLSNAPARVEELERVTQHDVIAFLTMLEQDLGEDARWLHLGLTSSDIVDTALGMALKESVDLIIAAQDRLVEVLDARAHEHRRTLCLGRTHGQAAEPTSFGIKLAMHAAGARRDRERLRRAREVISVGKLSGAVGTFAHLPPEVEAFVMERAGLRPEPVASQVVQRDRHAEFFCALAVVGASLERLAVEIRHLARTEVHEVSEPFGRGQKGSSAMPHKRNPIVTENLTGLARLLRGYAMAALEDVALWHERDISHSSVERVIGPDATILLHFAQGRMTRVIEGLVVDAESMKRNLDAAGETLHSQRLLLMLARKGFARQHAYEHVQAAAILAHNTNRSFVELLCQDPDVTAVLPEAEVRAACTMDHHLANADTLLARSRRSD